MAEPHVVYLAFGSNLGDRVAEIHKAWHALAKFVTIQESSFLYETAPAYIVTQPRFLNAVCKGHTTLGPPELLQAIEQLMTEQGRQQTIRYGPRTIDIDILFYDNLQLNTPQLTIPHPRMAEREFVLEPLCDIAPDLRHPILGRTIQQLWRDLRTMPMQQVTPIGNQVWQWGKKSYIMGVINLTPDSFSGDGLLAQAGDPIEAAVAQANRFVEEGADCLDVGGLSTRPGHRLIPVEDEIGRVVPVIQAIRQAVQVPVSIDTFRIEVAQAALDAGAQILNDIWGLRFDPEIGDLAAKKLVPLVLMHNRIEPVEFAYQQRVQRLPVGRPYEYTHLIDEICDELQQSLQLAQESGIPRWLLISDPGMGFGKTLEQQLRLIHQLVDFKAMGYPVLFGPSRKGFIGKVLGGLPPEERMEGTLAANVLAIERGADILRVHDVQAMSRAARMADAIVRNRGR